MKLRSKFFPPYFLQQGHAFFPTISPYLSDRAWLIIEGRNFSIFLEKLFMKWLIPCDN